MKNNHLENMSTVKQKIHLKYNDPLHSFVTSMTQTGGFFQVFNLDII